MSECTLIHGDCLDILPTLADNSIDSIVTDPPYELGFMGKSWDASGIAYNVNVWRECLRVLKPGGYLLAFGGSRTYHRLACAVEDAGFEIRDQIQWIYGSGFPKSLDVGKAIDKAAGAEPISTGGYKRASIQGKPFEESYPEYTKQIAITTPATPDAIRWDGWGTALKPAHEPIVVARKPFPGTVAANVLEWGTGAINVDGSRVPHDEPIKPMKAQDGGNKVYGQSGRYEETTELKANGRWPANVIHDGSNEVVGLFPVTSPARQNAVSDNRSQVNGSVALHDTRSLGMRTPENSYNDNGGSASRFFYCAKASRSDRNEGCEGMELGEPPGTKRSKPAEGRKSARGEPVENHHPTVKPTALMRYLCRLVTQPGGVVLDPFTGSGSTGKGAMLEGFNFVGIDKEAEYLTIAEARIQRARQNAEIDTLPMFAGVG